MKKLSILLMVFMLVGCSLFDDKDALEERDVIVSIVEGSVTPEGLTLSISNNNNTDFSYNNYYELFKASEEGGVEIDKIKELEEESDIMSLQSKHIKELEIDWSEIYGTLSPGSYIIEKSILTPGTKEGTDAKFRIEFQVSK